MLFLERVKFLAKMNRIKWISLAVIVGFMLTANAYAVSGGLLAGTNTKESTKGGTIQPSVIPPDTVSFTQPSNASTVYVTGQYTIEWLISSYYYYYAYVNLSLYRGNTMVYKIVNIVSSFTNYATSYTWTVPSNLTTPSNQYHIQAMYESNVLTTIIGNSPNFIINVTQSVFNCTSDPIVYLNGQDVIYWEATIPFVNIYLYLGTTLVRTIATNIAGEFWGNEIEYRYVWYVPMSIAGGAGYQIRISKPGSPSDHANSNGFEISGSIQITNVQTQGTVFAPSETYISWNSVGDIPAVDISLYNGTSLVKSLVTNLANYGGYLWIVPATLAQGGNYSVRVLDHAFNGLFDDSAPFYINATHKISDARVFVLDEYANTANNQVYLHDNVEIEWTATAPVTAVDLLLFQGTTQIMTIASDVLVTSHYYWLVNTTAATAKNYTVRVSEHGMASDFSNSSVFTINTTAFLYEVDAPYNIEAGSPVSIDWYNRGIINAVDINLTQIVDAPISIVKDEPNYNSYTWFVPKTITPGLYDIVVYDHANHTDSSLAGISISHYAPPKMPWGVTVGETLQWTAGVRLVLNMPDAFWQSVDALLAGEGITGVSSKDIYNAVTAALPNSWNIKAVVSSILNDNVSSGSDMVYANMTMKANTNSTYQAPSAYLQSLEDQITSALGPLYSVISPGYNAPIQPDSLSSAAIYPPFVLPTNTSFSTNWMKEIYNLQNESGFVSDFGSWANLESYGGFTVNANTTGMSASINGITLDNYLGTLPQFSGIGAGPLVLGMRYLSDALGANISLTSAVENASFNYNSSMVLLKASSVGVITGTFTPANGASYPFTISLEAYIYQGQLPSISYHYSNTSSSPSVPGYEVGLIMLFASLFAIPVIIKTKRLAA